MTSPKKLLTKSGIRDACSTTEITMTVPGCLLLFMAVPGSTLVCIEMFQITMYNLQVDLRLDINLIILVC